MDNLFAIRSAVSVLPLSIRQPILALSDDIKREIEEIRLRISRPVTVTIRGREREINRANGELILATSQDISLILDIATRSSIHTAIDTIRCGFITIKDGHRIGICGSAVLKDGVITHLRNYSSLNIRVAREVKGCSNQIFSDLMYCDEFLDTLVISPPGIGKTTLIRDIIRNLSAHKIRTAVADERGELSAINSGVPQFDLGAYVDVIDGAPKSEAMLMLLKTMSPAVISVDEITSPEDVKAAEMASNCGVRLLASAHATDIYDLKSREVTKSLLEKNLFRRVVEIKIEKGIRKYEVKTVDGLD